MTTNAEALANSPGTPSHRSLFGVISDHPILFGFALAAGAALLGGALLLLGAFSDSEEAPIRVRSGSIDLYILSGTQQWEQVGGSDTWRIQNAERYKEEFEVTVAVRAGADCGGSMTATGSDIVLTYNNNNQVRLQSAGYRTVVKPGNGVSMTWDATTPQKLSYVVTGGFIRSIAVGNGTNPATMCSFSAPGQLDHLIVLNVP